MLTIGALFWKHLLIKCTETGGEQRKTERADPPQWSPTQGRIKDETLQNTRFKSNHNFADNSG